MDPLSQRILFFDTETTSKALFGQPASHPDQPHIVQLAAILTNQAGREVAAINTLIRPDGWTISAEAADVHGISQETCDLYGVPLGAAMQLFLGLASQADLLVAHNLDFDRLVVDAAAYRVGVQMKPLPGFCTMHGSAPVCRIPSNNGRPGWKWPRLNEAYRHFFGRDLAGAHNAFADARACRDVFFGLHGVRKDGDLQSAAEMALRALYAYRQYDEAMAKDGRGLYDSTYETVHAIPALERALGESAT
jgi:DNA polymerase-3 subunit epsilon